VTASGPLILAIETATNVLSAALMRGDELLAEEQGARGRSAAETLLPCIDAAFAKADLSPRDVEAFAVSVGPGSFTSLRVGIATAKGLAFGSTCPVAPVRTLAALALAAGPGVEPIVTLLDARRGELYAAAWTEGGAAPHPVLPEGVYTPEQVVAALRPSTGPSAAQHRPVASVAPAPLRGACRVAGEGALLFREVLAAGLPPDAVILPDLEAPSARHVGVLGARTLAAGLGLDAADLLPHYVRRAEAEVKRTGLRFEGV
jgi:tRNA threonylcarbamoyladenosine biosynthesis protein TsaB